MTRERACKDHIAGLERQLQLFKVALQNCFTPYFIDIADPSMRATAGGQVSLIHCLDADCDSPPADSHCRPACLVLHA